MKVWVIGIQLYWHFHNLTRSDKKLKFPKYYCPEITFLPLTHHLFHYSHDDANCVFSSLKARKAQVSKWFELWGSIWSCSVIVHVRIGPRGTVVTWLTDISMTLAEANIRDEFLTTTVQTTLMMISAKVVRGKSPLPQQSQVKEINMK